MQNSQTFALPFGIVTKVDISSMSCVITNGYGDNNVLFNYGDCMFVIPKVNELWAFYSSGHKNWLFKRVAVDPSDDESNLFEGDMLLSVNGVLHAEAESVDIRDSSGQILDSVTHMLDFSRQHGSRVYIVKDKSDKESIDKKIIEVPCLLAIVDGDNVSFKYREK